MMNKGKSEIVTHKPVVVNAVGKPVVANVVSAEICPQCGCKQQVEYAGNCRFYLYCKCSHPNGVSVEDLC